MAESKKEKILNKVAVTLLKGRSEKGVKDALEVLGKELKLDGAFVLRTSDIPFLFELKYLWEPKKNIAGKRLMLDVSEAPDWGFFNPFSEGEEGKESVINDFSKTKTGPIVADFIKNLGLKAATSFILRSEGNFLGFIVYFNNSPREWTDVEVDILRQSSELISTEVDVIRMDETRIEILDDYDKRIKNANDAKNKFIANISHEIRTPINAVVGMVSIMRHNMESPDVIAECLDRMEKSTKSLMDVVNDCVDMTLINDREMPLNNSWIPLSSLISGLKHIIEPLAQARNQHVDYEFDESLSVFADEVKLARVLTTSLTNSCHSAENNTNICLSIKCEKSGAKDVVSFRIRDEVAGLDPEAAKHIFEPFGGEHFHDAFRGTGLGMVLTKHLVEMMNGTVDFFSDGWGTELVASLPLQIRGGKTVEKPQTDTSSEDVPEEYAELYIGRRVLIAEDNVLMGEILATILGYRGLETDIAFNGQEAYDRYVGNNPFYYDMILMDIQMPVMDGIEASRAIRSSGRADAEMIPIAALSANAFEDDVNNALGAGMNAYLRKPVGDKELFETISNLIL